MLNLLITIDTELSPGRGVATDDALARNYRGAIDGETSRGAFGVGYQLEVFARHGLKAVFFVEALVAQVVGNDVLRRIVTPIRDAGHEVQLHLHPEWLAQMPANPLDGRTAQNIGDLAEDDQARLIAIGLDALSDAGADRATAFRAGNYGADTGTLHALNRNGVRFDSSYNLPYLGNPCRIKANRPLSQPTDIHGIREVPITAFEDRPGHLRHTQICACSFAELAAVIDHAVDAAWPTLVLVSHSFELLNRARTRPNPIVVRRFDKLCRFLAERRDRVRTVGFNDLDETVVHTGNGPEPFRSHPARTLARVAEQVLGRVYERP